MSCMSNAPSMPDLKLLRKRYVSGNIQYRIYSG